jgi:hypothetical protein
MLGLSCTLWISRGERVVAKRTEATGAWINSELAQSGFDGTLVVAGEEPLGPPGAIVWRLETG